MDVAIGNRIVVISGSSCGGSENNYPQGGRIIHGDQVAILDGVGLGVVDKGESIPSCIGVLYGPCNRGAGSSGPSVEGHIIGPIEPDQGVGRIPGGGTGARGVFHPDRHGPVSPA